MKNNSVPGACSRNSFATLQDAKYYALSWGEGGSREENALHAVTCGGVWNTFYTHDNAYRVRSPAFPRQLVAPSVYAPSKQWHSAAVRAYIGNGGGGNCCHLSLSFSLSLLSERTFTKCDRPFFSYFRFNISIIVKRFRNE